MSLCHRLDIIELKSLQSRLEKLENNRPAQNSTTQTTKDAAVENTELVQKINPDQNDHKKGQQPEPVSTIAQDSEILPMPKNSRQSATPGWQEESQSDQSPIQTDNLSTPDINIVWQNILTDLQRRHLPTFSLVSTHAFPVTLINNILTIGVLVENFQKMIENKIEHIKVAAIACQLDPNLKVQVKIIAEGAGSRPARVETRTNEVSLLVSSSSKEENDTAAATVNRSSPEKQNKTAVQEAYRLFEGPGSRFIAPNQ